MVRQVEFTDHRYVPDAGSHATHTAALAEQSRQFVSAHGTIFWVGAVPFAPNPAGTLEVETQSALKVALIRYPVGHDVQISRESLTRQLSAKR